MKEKKIGLTVKKSENFSEWFTQICGESGAQLADVRYGVQGFVVHRPWAMRILRRIYELLEEAVEADGHEPHLFPTAIPEENLQREKEHAGFTPEVFWIEAAGSSKLERRFGLRPTGETQFYPMYSLWIQSYNDLPYKGYQSRITVFRNEMTTRPFLRGREFMFFETHDVFRTHEEAVVQIRTDMEIMEEVVHKKLKIPFLFLKRPYWDKFKGADASYCSDSLLPDGRRNQISSTHDLGNNFAKAFDVKFMDEDGKEKFGWQTCFGPGIWRIMAQVIAVHGDDQGLLLPFDIAPVQIVIVPITFSHDKTDVVISAAKKLQEKIEKLGFSVKVDVSSNTPGFKYNQWEMLGVPLRVEIGPKEVEEKIFTIVRRTDRKKVKVKESDIKEAILSAKKEVDDELTKRSDAYVQGNTKKAKNLQEVKSIINTHRGFVVAPFCSDEPDGIECAKKLKEDVSVDTCGIPFENAQQPSSSEKCIVCRKPAKHLMYIAKSI